jgi:uncharacterized protein YjbJ (UPF0337 family)
MMWIEVEPGTCGWFRLKLRGLVSCFGRFASPTNIILVENSAHICALADIFVFYPPVPRFMEDARDMAENENSYIIRPPSAKDEIAGQPHEVKGKIKEKVGRLTNDPDLEGEGIGEKIAGKVQKKIGHRDTKHIDLALRRCT